MESGRVGRIGGRGIENEGWGKRRIKERKKVVGEGEEITRNTEPFLPFETV